jgi:hypothetical protein
MTPDAFRALALALPDAEQGSHMGSVDFRVNGRIFATSGAGTGRPVVKLPPEVQEMLMAAEPDVLAPASGAWGRAGSTHIALDRADAALVRDLLARAHAHVCAKPPGRPRRKAVSAG